MSRVSFRVLLVLVLTTGLLLGTAVMAGHPYPYPAPPQAAPWRFWGPSHPKVGQSPYGVSVAPPGPQRYPQYSSGNYPWYGYGFGVPTYQWGYFGAHSHGTGTFPFYGYQQDYSQWSWQRGY